MDAGTDALESADERFSCAADYEIQLRKFQQQLATCKMVQQELEKSLGASRRDLAASRQDLAASTRDLAASRQDLADSRRDLAASRQDLAASTRELDSSRRSIDVFREELETSRTNFTRLQRESAATIDRVTQQYTDASRRCRDADQRIWDQIRQIGELTRELEAARRDADAIKCIQTMSASLVTENHRLREQVFEMQRLLAASSTIKPSAVEKKAECVLCMSDLPSCYVKKCGHLISCKDCARNSTLFTCPFCRQDKNTELIETTGITNCQCGNPSNMVCKTCQHISMCSDCCSHHQSCSACGTTGGKFKRLFSS
jgi:DNA repair exonuclease SbcCD ATPase subunit